jgi:hypothetical protein
LPSLLELADKCERASGPDRELDEAIARQTHILGRRMWSGVAKPYTASLDSAMTLVPEGSAWRVVTWPKNTEGPKAGALVEGAPDVLAATPALALCAAALRARGNNG